MGKDSNDQQNYGGDQAKIYAEIRRVHDPRDMSGKSAKFVGSRSSSAKSAGFSGFNTTSNILYGITEDDSDILQLEERKGRRGNLETLGHDDIEMGLENSGPGGLAFRGGANISREDLVAPGDHGKAELAMQASPSL